MCLWQEWVALVQYRQIDFDFGMALMATRRERGKANTTWWTGFDLINFGWKIIENLARGCDFAVIKCTVVQSEMLHFVTHLVLMGWVLFCSFSFFLEKKGQNDLFGLKADNYNLLSEHVKQNCWPKMRSKEYRKCSQKIDIFCVEKRATSICCLQQICAKC